MCLAAPGRIIKIEGKKATVKYPGSKRFAFVGEKNVKVGDFVLVQMGIIVQKISSKDTKEAERAWG